MPEFHDLGEKPSEAKMVGAAPPEAPKVYYPSLDITIKQVPELEDFEAGDVVDFHIRTFVTKKIERAVPPGEKKEPDSVQLEMRKAKILNLKPLRKEALEKGLPMKEMKDLDSHRKNLKKKEKG